MYIVASLFGVAAGRHTTRGAGADERRRLGRRGRYQEDGRELEVVRAFEIWGTWQHLALEAQPQRGRLHPLQRASQIQPAAFAVVRKGTMR